MVCMERTVAVRRGLQYNWNDINDINESIKRKRSGFTDGGRSFFDTAAETTVWTSEKQPHRAFSFFWLIHFFPSAFFSHIKSTCPAKKPSSGWFLRRNGLFCMEFSVFLSTWFFCRYDLGWPNIFHLRVLSFFCPSNKETGPPHERKTRWCDSPASSKAHSASYLDFLYVMLDQPE